VVDGEEAEGELTEDDIAFEEYCCWYEENLYIVTKGSKVIPFKMKNVQRVLERYKWDCRREGRPCWMLILKGRQIGISTWASATNFRDNREVQNRRILSIAHDDDATSNIFGMTKLYQELFPDEIPLRKSNARELHFDDTNSLFRVRTAGAAGSVGRSATVQGVHLSEIDKWPFPEELYQALMPTIPDTGDVLVIAESTADGPMLMMNQLWDDAIEGKNEYFPFFFPWWTDDDCVREKSYDDLVRYGPKDWVNQNKNRIRNCIRRDERKAKDHGMEPDDLYGRGVLADRESRLARGTASGHDSPAEAAGNGSGAETCAPSGEGSGETAPTAGTLRQEGIGPRGHLYGSPSEVAPRRVGFAIRALGRMSGDVRSKGTPVRARLPEDRGSPEEGWDTSGTFDYFGRPMDPLEELDSELTGLYRDSLTSYELGLADEFDLTFEQINWLRYCLGHKCKGDETKRRREYPSRDSEAFEATGKDILDPLVLARWAKEAKDTPPLAKGYFKVNADPTGGPPDCEFVEDGSGKIEFYENPKEHTRYVMFFDPSSGTMDSDWQVGYVMNVETGDQAAEFRATINPDEAVDQLEALALHFKVKKLAIECNGGYGTPFIRHMVDRRTVPLYEREMYHKFTKQLMKVPGWDTNPKTRPLMVAESKEAVRKERCKIKSEMTIRECRTLWENPAQHHKIEGRPPNHDDGWIAYCGCLILRNNEIQGEKSTDRSDRKNKSLVAHLNKLDRRSQKSTSFKRLLGKSVWKKKIVGRGQTVRPDGRRSWI